MRDEDGEMGEARSQQSIASPTKEWESFKDVKEKRFLDSCFQKFACCVQQGKESEV